MNEVPLHMWLSGPLPKGVEHHLHRLRQTEGIDHIAVMPDVHLAGEFCVGTVVASEGHLFPNAVGGDIGCGMLALQFDQCAEVLADSEYAARLLGVLYECCPSRRHHLRTAHNPSADIRALALSHDTLNRRFTSEELRLQLGTLGAGNHFLEFQADESGCLWLMIHTGSRNLGQCILEHHLPKTRRLSTGIAALEADSQQGRDYLNDVEVARAWARENRRLLAITAGRVAEEILGAAPLFDTLYDCDHNHLQIEIHHEKSFFVHRKGATNAAKSTRGIIPGSMGTRSYHTQGKGKSDSLHSSSHGAGRELSRTQAREKISVSRLRQQLNGTWYDVRLESALREEAPAAYRKIDEVMRAQSDLTAIVRKLRPVLIHKGA